MGLSDIACHRAFKSVATPRNGLTVLIAGICLAIVFAKIGELDTNRLVAAIEGVRPWQWCLAVLATAISFAAVGQYDALFHGWLKTGISRRRAAMSGAASIAVAQLAGLGLVTGTLARWRALPELSMAKAALVTQYVSFSFMGALGIVIALALAVSPWAAADGLGSFAAVAVILTLLAAILSVARPNSLPVRLPPLVLMWRLTLLLLVDVFFAALALYVLLPSGLSIPFGTVFVAFLLGVGAGLISGTPGGIGPFELCLISLLPLVPEPELVAAILSFRLVYYVLPAGAALLYLAWPRVAGPALQLVAEEPKAGAEATGLARLPGQELFGAGAQSLHLAEASQTLVLLGDRSNGTPLTPADLERLSQEARARGCSPALYKTGRRSAFLALSAGWSVIKVSEEAFLTPADFTTDGPARRQLRRKLKQASKAGVTVLEADTLPVLEMARVAAAWAERNGGERGFSMGRFDVEYIRSQRCFLAYRNGRLLAFATFHTGPGDWCLDVMRSADDAVDGTMHALIVKAIETAADDQVARLSLAAMPLATPPALLRHFAKSCGLRRFKQTFAPRTRSLYLAAPSPALLALAGLDILLRIRFPEPLAGSGTSPALQRLQGWFDRMRLVLNPFRTHLSTNRETPLTIEVNQ